MAGDEKGIDSCDNLAPSQAFGRWGFLGIGIHMCRDPAGEGPTFWA